MSEGPLIPTYDKSKWARGPWDNESDRVDFIHTGLSCFILRNHSGNWCGYVGVPKGHSCYEKPYDDVNVDVHGGLTYADKCGPPICHIPEPGMPDDVWWLGFDTGHYMDASPGRMFIHDFLALRKEHDELFGGDVYRDMEYTLNETRQLAEQLSKM